MEIIKSKGYNVINWIGSISGILGALLLAFNFTGSKYGYFLFLASAIFLTFSFTKQKNYAMMVQQSIFLIINSIGVYSWIL